MDGSTPAGLGREAPESSKCCLAWSPSPAPCRPTPHPVARVSIPSPAPWIQTRFRGPGKLTLKIFDGNDALQRNHFRVISVPRLARNEEVLVRAPGRGRGRGPGVLVAGSPAPVHTGPALQEAALRAYYVLEDPRDFELQPVPAPVPAGDSGARGRPRGSGAAEEEGGRGPEAWIVRAVPHAQELLRIYPAWLK